MEKNIAKELQERKVAEQLCKLTEQERKDATRRYINPPYKNGSCKVYLPITNE